MQVYYYPHPVLKERAREMTPEEIDDDFRAMLPEMFQTMYDDKGIGLAATQVGITKRFFIVNLQGHEDAPPLRPGFEADQIDAHEHVFINPEVLERDDQTAVGEEGCLSLPNIRDTVERPIRIKVRALERDGTPFELEARGLLARAILHELDHLDGVMFIDHLSEVQLARHRGTLNDLRKRYEKEKKAEEKQARKQQRPKRRRAIKK